MWYGGASTTKAWRRGAETLGRMKSCSSILMYQAMYIEHYDAVDPPYNSNDLGVQTPCRQI